MQFVNIGYAVLISPRRVGVKAISPNFPTEIAL